MMSQSTVKEFRMERLNARNYTTWKTVMESLLKSKGLWNYVKVPIVNETEDDLKKNEEAKHLMYMAMETQQIIATGSCELAYHLWEKVQENHEGSEVDLRNNSLSDFLSLKYGKNENMIQFCGRYEVALGRVETQNNRIDEKTKLWVFRNSLPKEMKQIANTWAIAKPEGKIVVRMGAPADSTP